MTPDSTALEKNVATRPVSYAFCLRAIGQALEAVQIRFFDIENKDDGEYLVWDRTNSDPAEAPPQFAPNDSSRESLWRRFSRVARRRKSPLASPDRAPERSVPLRYTAEDIQRLDQEGREGRRGAQAVPDPYRLSQLLRAIGGYVHQQQGRLRGICWRGQWVALVYEKDGKREFELLRPSLIYDFWVRMYLRRDAAVH
jgi:hypothetical protein